MLTAAPPPSVLAIARRFHRLGQTVLLSLLALACETDFMTVEAPAVERVVVSPSDVILAPGETQQFSAQGIDAAGDTAALTVIWSASGGRIGAGGLFTASEPGTYAVVATVPWERSLQGSAVLSVAPAAPDTDSTPPGPARVDPVAGLVAHWPLDEGSGTVGADATGNGHDVTLQGGAGWTAGVMGSALALDGSDDFAELAASGPLATPLTTWAAWVRTPSPTTAHQMLMTLGRDVRELRFDATTGRVQTNWLIGGVKRKATSPTALSPNTWYHVAATFDGSEVVLYVDGVAVDVVGTSGSFAVASESLYLGRRIDGWHLGGALDDVRIYDRALTPSEIADLAVPDQQLSTTLSIVTQPPPLSVGGSVFTRAPQVLVEDTNSDPLTGQDVAVTIASGGGDLGGTTTVVTDATGTATFTDLSITGAPGARTLSFTSGGASVTSDPVHVSYAPGIYGDVPYCSSQVMDVHIPDTSFPRPLPAAMYVHGGGWVSGDKSTGLLLAEVRDELLLRGYLVASINYRLATASSNQWPAQIEDVKCAVRHLRAQAGDYGLDAQRIGAWGASAGGHLVSMLGVTDASSGFEGDGGFPGVSSRLQAAVPVGGISDLTGGPTHPELNFDGPEDTFESWPGPSTELTEASPITWASSDDPPFLIVHGEHDDVVLHAQADTLKDELAAVGVSVTLRTVVNGGHNLEDVGVGPPTPSIAEVTEQIRNFFDVYVAQTVPPEPDTEAPSAPEGLTADGAAGVEVALVWQAATDNVAVTGYRIYRDDVEVATVTETTYTDTSVDPSTAYTYEVSALDAAGNESARSAPAPVTTAEVNRDPTAIATADPTSGFVPLTVSFTGSGSSDPDGPIASYSWTFGDGGTSDEADPEYTYAETGTYTATLTVTDEAGAQASASVDVTVMYHDTAARYGLLERTLTHSGTHANPYAEVTATATLVAPGGALRTIPLFWDGGTDWKLRFSPDVTGTWGWSVTSSDPGLDGEMGELSVVGTSGSGSIRAMTGAPYHFERQDGTGIWWMGDTQWLLYGADAGEGLNRASVFHYVDVRSAQGFNVVHSMLMPWNGVGNEGGQPFLDFAGETINPAYWQEVDARLAYMNTQGITAGLLVAWGYDVGWESFLSDEARLRYARYAVARYSAYDVYFIVSGDQALSAANLALYRLIGEELADNDPHGRMISLHTSDTSSGSVEVVADDPWMSFGDYQQIYQQLHTSILDSRDHLKPAVNAEYAYYLRDADGDGVVDKPNSATLEEIRHATYDIVMAGGYFVTGWGSTYLGGFRDPGPFDPDDPRDDDWEEDVQHLRSLFTGLDWWTLQPNDGLITSSGEHHALAEIGNAYLAYVRNGQGAATLELGGAASASYTIQRFDPRTGLYTTLPGHTGTGPVSLDVPDDQDWVFRVIHTDNDFPVAVAAADPTSGDAPLLVSFTGSGSSDADGQIVTYAWTFGDGGSSDVANPQHTYTTAGDYTATLTVTDDGGAQASATVDVTVTAPPDTEPPSIPEGLTADGAAGTEVTLSWSAATDNVGVTGYRVYRDDVVLATVT
ncbi:MAG TPA: PKD domain-containing protein, partial [Longimicrobiales bacterium]|nr:PKD domain-containing protein [Longimicrobiales bacterium]